MNSNDLLKRIDDVFAKKEINVGDLLADCRAALEAKGEPVAWLDLKKLSVGGKAYATSRNANSRQVPLYTAPQSVEALIAEIDDWLTNGWDRALLGNNEHPTLTEILDKYRNKK